MYSKKCKSDLSYTLEQRNALVKSYKERAEKDVSEYVQYIVQGTVSRRLFITALQWLAIAQGPKIS